MSVCVVMWFDLFHITSSETCNVTGSLWFTVHVYVYVCGVNVGEGHFFHSCHVAHSLASSKRKSFKKEFISAKDLHSTYTFCNCSFNYFFLNNNNILTI